MIGRHARVCPIHGGQIHSPSAVIGVLERRGQPEGLCSLASHAVGLCFSQPLPPHGQGGLMSQIHGILELYATNA